MHILLLAPTSLMAAHGSEEIPNDTDLEGEPEGAADFVDQRAASVDDDGLPEPRSERGASRAIPSRSPSFVANRGQLDAPGVLFYASSGPLRVGLTPSAVLYDVHGSEGEVGGALVRVDFQDALPITPSGEGERAVRSHFFTGPGPSEAWTDVPSYDRVTYSGLWNGITLTYELRETGPKYTFTVEPGADEARIALRYSGVSRLSIEKDGRLVAQTAVGPLEEDAPSAWTDDGTAVECAFTLQGQTTVGFRCLGRDASERLTIDPLVYAALLGGEGNDSTFDMTIDAQGNAYAVGNTSSRDFPTTIGPYGSPNKGGTVDAFVAKLSPDGSALVYAAYIGGSDTDTAYAVRTDAQGRAVVVGRTDSADFPVTSGAYQVTKGAAGTGLAGEDCFVTRLSPDGASLEMSTFLGGGNQDFCTAVSLDEMGDIYVTGLTWGNFTTTTGAYRETAAGGREVFVVKMASSGASILFSTFLGGPGHDAGNAIVVDSNHDVYVSGEAKRGFPVTLGAYQMRFGGGNDGFVAKLDSAGANLLYSTFLGGSSDEYATGLAVDASGNGFVTGWTWSDDFPTTAGAFQTAYSGGTSDGWLVKVDPAGASLQYSTYIGGSGGEWANEVALDASGAAWVAGNTNAGDLYTTADAVASNYGGGGADGMLIEISSNGSSSPYSSYVGGAASDELASVAVGADGKIFAAGTSKSSDLPITDHAIDSTPGGAQDVFAIAIDFRPRVNITLTTVPAGLEVAFDGQARAGPATFACAAGSSATISASPIAPRGDARLAFDNWSDAGAAAHQIRCNGDRTFTARAHQEFQALFRTSPTEFEVTVDGTAVRAPAELWWPEGSVHTLDVQTPQPFDPDVRFVWRAWSDGGPINQTIVALRPVTFQAEFQRQYRLTTTGVTGNPPCEAAECWFNEGAEVTLSVPAVEPIGDGARRSFRGWTGDLRSEQLDVSVRMDGPKNVVAEWRTQYYLTVVSPYATPTGSGWYDEGAIAEFSVDADLVVTNGSRFQFSGWSGDFYPAAHPGSTKMDGPKRVVAVWVAGASVQPWLPDGAAQAFVVVGFVAVGMAISLSSRSKWAFATLLFVPLFLRLKKDELKQQFQRGRILQFVEDHPGASYSEIRRRLALANGSCAYHLGVLEKAGEIKRMASGASVRFFSAAYKVDAESLPSMTLFQRQLLAVVVDLPPSTAGAITAALRAGSPEVTEDQVNYHLRVLVREKELIQSRRDSGRRVFFVEGETRGYIARRLGEEQIADAFLSQQLHATAEALSPQPAANLAGGIAGDVMRSPPMRPAPAAKGPVEILSAVDFVSGYVRLKVAIHNWTTAPTTELKFELDFDHEALRLERTHPAFPVADGRYQVGSLAARARKVLEFYFDPKTCAKTHLDGSLKLRNSNGRLDVLKMAPRVAVVWCPELEVSEPCDAATLKAIVGRTSPDPARRVIRYSLNLGRGDWHRIGCQAAVAFRMDVACEYRGRDGLSVESWFFGRPKGTPSAIVLCVSTGFEPGTLDLFATADSAPLLAGFLAEYRERLAKEVAVVDVSGVLESSKDPIILSAGRHPQWLLFDETARESGTLRSGGV